MALPDSLDWKEQGPEAEINQVLNHKHLSNGSIILFHNDAKYTPQVLDTILKGLKEKGYEIDTSDIQIKDDENYTIEKITLKLIKMEQKQGKNNEIVINTVEIGNTISQKDSKTLSDDDKQEVKDYISETYDIDKKNINIS